MLAQRAKMAIPLICQCPPSRTLLLSMRAWWAVSDTYSGRGILAYANPFSPSHLAIRVMDTSSA
jgi:hypothetical protein